MPQIKDYTQRVSAPGPQDRRRPAAEDYGGGTGLQQLGAGITNLGEQVQKRAEQVEQSDLNQQISKAHAEWTVKMNEHIQKGDLEPDKFVQEFDKTLSSMEEGIQTRGGQEYFNQAATQLKSHFIESATAAGAQLAGEKAKTNYLDSFNSQSSALLNDPSSFEMTKQLHDLNLNEMVKNNQLPAEVADKLRQQGDEGLAKSAIKGWIKLNPDLAKKQLDSGQWDKSIDGQAKAQLYGEIDQSKRAAEADAARARADQERIKNERQEKIQSGFLDKMQKNELTAKDILESDLDAFGSGSKNQFIEMLKTNSEQKLKADPATYVALFERIHLPDGDPNKITSENALNRYFPKLGMDALQALRNEVQGNNTAAGSNETVMKNQIFQQAKGKLTKSNPMMGFIDVKGEERYQRFISTFLPEYTRQREAGKTAQQLLDPSSPDYLGNMINKFTGTPQEIIKDLTSSMRNKSKSSPFKDIKPEDISKMDRKQLDELDANGLSASQKEAARQRYNELAGH